MGIHRRNYLLSGDSCFLLLFFRVEGMSELLAFIAILLLCLAVSLVFVEVEEFIKTNQMSKGVAAIYVSTAVLCAALIITFSYM